MAKRPKSVAGRWAPPKPTPEDFVVTLEQLGPASLDGGVMLEATVTNHGTAPRTYGLYYTPFEGFLNDILEVVDARGGQAHYTGPLKDRIPPGPAHFETLRPGETHGVRFDLSQHYTLAPGVYTVRTRTDERLPASPPLQVTVAAHGERRAPPATSLEAVLSVEPGASVARGVVVRLAVYDHDEKPHRFCTYHTPFEGLSNDILEIVDAAGKPIPYAGMMAKRAPPSDDDFITLRPGHFRAQRVDIRQGYRLTPGPYRARFRGGSISELPSSAFVSFTVAP